MTKRLLDRQSRLLEYLTSADAIFRDARNVRLDPSLEGVDPVLLHTEARFSHEKRMTKLAAVFPKTFALLSAEQDKIVREFVEACPPTDISRIGNARQFRAFLKARWRIEPPAPPYLPDVTICELACAQVRLDGQPGWRLERDRSHTGPPAMRRKLGVILLRTSFDVRPIFENVGLSADPIRREVLLAFTLQGGEPQISELRPEVFDLVSALNDWVPLGEFANADDLMAELTEAGLLETRP